MLFTEEAKLSIFRYISTACQKEHFEGSNIKIKPQIKILEGKFNFASFQGPEVSLKLPQLQMAISQARSNFLRWFKSL